MVNTMKISEDREYLKELRIQKDMREAINFFMSIGWEIANRNTGCDVITKNGVYMSWNGELFEIVEHRKPENQARRKMTDLRLDSGFDFLMNSRTTMGRGGQVIEWNKRFDCYTEVKDTARSVNHNSVDKTYIPDKLVL